MMFKNAIKNVHSMKVKLKTVNWTKKNLKKSNLKYDFCCLILGQKHCGNCILDKRKTK